MGSGGGQGEAGKTSLWWFTNELELTRTCPPRAAEQAPVTLGERTGEMFVGFQSLPQTSPTLSLLIFPSALQSTNLHGEPACVLGMLPG